MIGGVGVVTRCLYHFLCCMSSVPSEVFGFRFIMLEAFFFLPLLPFWRTTPFSRERRAGLAELKARNFASPNLHLSALLWETGKLQWAFTWLEV